MSLSLLAQRVADLRRQLTATLTTLAEATLIRAFNALEWDENQHPRGANGKFIGGDGLHAERELAHLNHGLKTFDARTKTLDPAVVQQAKERMTWRGGYKGYRDVRMQATTDLITKAENGARSTAVDRMDLMRLAYLRNLYLRAAAKATISAAAKARLRDEVAIIDRYTKRFGRLLKPTDAMKLPADERTILDAQVHDAIARDATQPSRAATRVTAP
jgi:hypothetical protein